jgi:hypothetical protein
VLASKHVTIYGGGVSVIDAHKKDQMFYVRAGGSLTMNGVIMDNGRTASNAGAVYCVTGHLGCAFTNCTFRNNENVAASTSSGISLAGARERAGAVNCEAGVSSVQTNQCLFMNCIFSNNQCTASSACGGAVSAMSFFTPFTNCIFTNNTAAVISGGAGGAIYGNSGAITNCIFRSNAAASEGPASGGAVYSASTAVSYGPFTNCIFTNNTASSPVSFGGTNSGGAVLSAGHLLGPFTNCIFTNNTASVPLYDGLSGGAVSTVLGVVSFTNCIFANNTAHGGYAAGAVNSGNSGGSFTNCTFVYNTASGGTTAGGAVYGGGSFTNCTFSNNTASSTPVVSSHGGGSAGGAICSRSAGGGICNNCTFVYNTAVVFSVYASISGGAVLLIAFAAPVRSFANCIFSHNTALSTSSGGGAVVGGSSFANCTFNYNNASSTSVSPTPTHIVVGGAVLLQGGVLVTNCTFSDNMAYRQGSTGIAGALYVRGNSDVHIIGCKFFLPTNTSRGNNDIARYDTLAPRGIVTFACPAGTTGKPVLMTPEELLVSQLPPQQHILNCTPNAFLLAHPTPSH